DPRSSNATTGSFHKWSTRFVGLLCSITKLFVEEQHARNHTLYLHSQISESWAGGFGEGSSSILCRTNAVACVRGVRAREILDDGQGGNSARSGCGHRSLFRRTGIRVFIDWRLG